MKFLNDHFDRLLMLTVTMTFLVCWITWRFDELARLTELSFVGLTALVGGRRNQSNTTQSGDVNVSPAETEGSSENKGVTAV